MEISQEDATKNAKDNAIVLRRALYLATRQALVRAQTFELLLLLYHSLSTYYMICTNHSGSYHTIHPSTIPSLYFTKLSRGKCGGRRNGRMFTFFHKNMCLLDPLTLLFTVTLSLYRTRDHHYYELYYVVLPE